MSSLPPDPRHWPVLGDGSPRVSEKELRENAELHERREEIHARTPWWRRLFHHRSSDGKGSVTD